MIIRENKVDLNFNELQAFVFDEGIVAPLDWPRTSEYLDWKAFGYFLTFYPWRILRNDNNITCAAMKK